MEFIGTTWQFPRDLSLIAWLEHHKYAYDVATDHDLAANPDLLKDYKVVLTGSHPEYWSEKGLNQLEDYIADGGRLMYLGGNGFYWVVSYRDGEPEYMEVRKGEAGMRAWQAEPGELYHQTSAERGGCPRAREARGRVERVRLPRASRREDEEKNHARRRHAS